MDPWIDFEILKATAGHAYTQKRNDFLKSGSNLADRLAGYEKDPIWQNATTARILSGWIAHRRDYEQLLQEIDREDPRAAARTAAGLSSIWNRYANRAAKEFKKDILPLCWEAMVKYSNDLPEWKMLTFLRMLSVVPDIQSIEPLIWYIEQATNYQLRHAAMQALTRIPRNATAQRIKQEQVRHAEIAELLRDALEEE